LHYTTSEDGGRTQAVEEVAKDLQSIKNILYGEGAQWRTVVVAERWPGR